MEPEGPLPYSQASATCPYPGPAQSSPHTHIPTPGEEIQYLSVPNLHAKFRTNLLFWAPNIMLCYVMLCYL